MRLSCPGCQTEYEVPDAALAGRIRTLRCANCGHQWEYGPLAVTAAKPDPEAAAWPGAAPRSVFNDTARPSEPETSRRAAETLRYEPLDTLTRGTWPPPSEPAAASSYEPLTTEQPAPAPEADVIHEQAATNEPTTSATAEPAASLPESENKPAIGNEERFAALVKTSRNEPEPSETGPGVRAGLFTTIILLIGIFGGIWAARFHIMQIWPPSTRLFDAINLMIANLTTPPHH